MGIKRYCDVCKEPINGPYYSIDEVNYSDTSNEYVHWERRKASTTQRSQTDSWVDYTDLHFCPSCWDGGKVDIAAIVRQRQAEFEEA